LSYYNVNLSVFLLFASTGGEAAGNFAIPVLFTTTLYDVFAKNT